MQTEAHFMARLGLKGLKPQHSILRPKDLNVKANKFWSQAIRLSWG